MKNLILVFAILVVGFEAFGAVCSVRDKKFPYKTDKPDYDQKRLCDDIEKAFPGEKYIIITVYDEYINASKNNRTFDLIVSAVASGIKDLKGKYRFKGDGSSGGKFYPAEPIVLAHEQEAGSRKAIR